VESFRPYAHSEPLARAIELLLIKLPDADGPVRTRQTPLPARVRKLLASEVAQIINDYQQGATVGQLAKTFNVDRNTIGRILQKTGVPQHPRGLTDGQITEAVQLYKTGISLARIGSRFGVDAHTVRRRLIERGVAMRDIHGRSR
jgi:transposase-like protein